MSGHNARWADIEEQVCKWSQAKWGLVVWGPDSGSSFLLDLKHTCKGTELGYFMTPFFFFWMLNVCIALTYELLKKTTVKICAFKGRPPS